VYTVYTVKKIPNTIKSCPTTAYTITLQYSNYISLVVAQLCILFGYHTNWQLSCNHCMLTPCMMFTQ